MEHLDKLGNLIDDDGAFCTYIQTMTQTDIADLIKGLVQKRLARKQSVRAYKDRKAEALGVSANWDWLCKNPIAYQKHVNYHREWAKRKRDNARPNEA